MTHVKSLKARKTTNKLLIYFVLSFLAIFLLLPFFWMLSTSFKGASPYFCSAD